MDNKRKGSLNLYIVDSIEQTMTSTYKIGFDDDKDDTKNSSSKDKRTR